MSNTTAQAASGALPASGHTSRRSLLSALAAAPLALPAVAATALPAVAAIPAIAGAAPAVADATILALAAKLADANGRLKPVLDRVAVAEKAFAARGLPARPERYALPETPEQAAAAERLRAAGQAFFKLIPGDESERFRREMRSWRRRESYWRRKTGLAEALAAQSRALDEMERLRSELVDTPAGTIEGLKAKARAWDGDDYEFAEAIVRELREFADA
jgi:hypothetical protein